MCESRTETTSRPARVKESGTYIELSRKSQLEARVAFG
jgi:hypothetical protein